MALAAPVQDGPVLPHADDAEDQQPRKRQRRTPAPNAPPAARKKLARNIQADLADAQLQAQPQEQQPAAISPSDAGVWVTRCPALVGCASGVMGWR